MRRFLAPVLVPLLALALSACGGDTIALNPVAEAAVRTQAADGMRVAMSGSFEGGGFDGSFAGDGILDGDTNSGRMSLSFTGGPADGQTFEMVEDGRVSYLRAPLLEGVLPAGKHWLKIDAEKIASSLGFNFQELTTTSPNQGLEQLREASKSVEEIGREPVRGVMTTHYRALLDPDKLKLPAKLIEMTDPQYGPVDVWIDADEMIRRQTCAASSRVPGQASRMEMRFTMEFFDFGVRVRVRPPPDDEVVDISDL